MAGLAELLANPTVSGDVATVRRSPEQGHLGAWGALYRTSTVADRCWSPPIPPVACSPRQSHQWARV